MPINFLNRANIFQLPVPSNSFSYRSYFKFPVEVFIIKKPHLSNEKWGLLNSSIFLPPFRVKWRNRKTGYLTDLAFEWTPLYTVLGRAIREFSFGMGLSNREGLPRICVCSLRIFHNGTFTTTGSICYLKKSNDRVCYGSSGGVYFKNTNGSDWARPNRSF